MYLSAYTPLYGGFPTNMAFDIAAACLSMKEGKMFGPPVGISLPPFLNVVAKTQDLAMSRICCLKFGHLGESGTITIAAY
jgi:hypothetical protein